MPISCFLEDIDPIFKLFKSILDGSSVLFGPVFSEMSKQHEFQDFEISKNMFSNTVSRVFLIFLESFGGFKVKKIGFGSHGHVPKSEKHGNEGFSGFPK